MAVQLGQFFMGQKHSLDMVCHRTFQCRDIKGILTQMVLCSVVPVSLLICSLAFWYTRDANWLSQTRRVSRTNCSFSAGVSTMCLVCTK